MASWSETSIPINPYVLCCEKSIRQLAYALGIADQTLRSWVKQTQIDAGEREGLTNGEREELRKLRRENRVLREDRPSHLIS